MSIVDISCMFYFFVGFVNWSLDMFMLFSWFDGDFLGERVLVSFCLSSNFFEIMVRFPCGLLLSGEMFDLKCVGLFLRDDV